ncbi:MAG: hypothetical protein QM811_22680 [Pirellulales bacterium]
MVDRVRRIRRGLRVRRVEDVSTDRRVERRRTCYDGQSYPHGERGTRGRVERRPRSMDIVSWIFLPALATYMLLAATNHLCQDVASVPFLWILPLSLYLLSFIVCFDHERWYVRPLFAICALVGLYVCAATHQLDFNNLQTLSKGKLTKATYPFAHPLYEKAGWSEPTVAEDVNPDLDPENPEVKKQAWEDWLARQQKTPYIEIEFYGQIVVHCFALFGVFMLCHGELTRRKPGPKHLTAFYLWIALGGALGGAFVSLAAPVLFNDYTEWLIGLMLCMVLAAALVLDQPVDRWYPARFLLMALPCAAIVLLMAWQNSSLPQWVLSSRAGRLSRTRRRRLNQVRALSRDLRGRLHRAGRRLVDLRFLCPVQ